MIEMTRHVHQVFALCMMKFLLIFMYLYTCTQSILKQILEYDITSICSKEYSTVDKVGCAKLLARNSCFVKNQLSPKH